MMRRSPTMAFAPGMYVFPGGRLDASDVAAGDLLVGYPFERDAERASTDTVGMRGLVACAIRETHEETGVAISAGDLVLVDHWVTPTMATRRFDVRFFAAALPAGQDAAAVGTEMDDIRWIEPLRALAEFEVDRMRMLRPTTRVLEFLAAFDRIDEVASAARGRSIRPRLPHRHPDGRWSILDDRTGEVLEEDVPEPRYWEGMEQR